MPGSSRFTTPVGVRLRDHDLKRLDERARDSGITRSALVSSMVQEALRKV